MAGPVKEIEMQAAHRSSLTRLKPSWATRICLCACVRVAGFNLANAEDQAAILRLRQIAATGPALEIERWDASNFFFLLFTVRPISSYYLLYYYDMAASKLKRKRN
jgi:hypothetical protein